MKYGIGEKNLKNKVKPLIKMEIEWIDSFSSKGWGPKSEHIKGFDHAKCRTVGYLIERTKKSISLAQSLSDITRNISDVMTIPTVAITKIKVLK